MKSLRHILFLLAAAITLLHALIPHENVERVEEHLQEYQQAQTIIDYLQLGVHINQGSGHLEHISAVQKINFDKKNKLIATQSLLNQLVLNSNFDSFYFQISQKNAHFLTQNELLPTSLRIRSNSLRAPPFSSIS